MTRSNWPQLVGGWYIDQERLWNVSGPRRHVSHRSPSGEVKPQRIYPIVFTISPMENGKKAGHCSGGNEVGADGSAVFLLSNPFLHELGVSLLLFDGVTLRAKGGFKDVAQLNLVGDVIFDI